MQRWWAIAAVGTMLAGCLKPATIETESPWVRLPAVAGRPASGYFILHGGATPTSLVSVTADRAIRTEMHRSMMAGGMAGGTAAHTMTMQPVRDLPLPAHGTIRFAPGGLHLMIFGLDPALKKGDSTILTFTFADGSRMQRKAWAVNAADPAPE